MGRIWRALNHFGMALFIFVTLSGVVLWSTGSLHIGLPAAAERHTEDDGHGHGAPAAHEADEEEEGHEGHDHAAHEADEDEGHEGHDHDADWCDEHGVPESACTRCNPDFIAQFKAKDDWCAEHSLPESQCEACNPGRRAKLEPGAARGDGLEALVRRNCEHGKPIVACDECRYQVGVVKVEPGVAKALLKTGKVGQREAVKTLRLTGEVQLDQTRVVDVPPTASGRVIQVRKFLGQPVAKGDVLAVVHSGDFGEAKAAYLGAHAQHEIARKEQERQAAVAAALEKLLKHLAERDGKHGEEAHPNSDAPKELVGEWKSKLLGAASRLRLAETNHRREKGLWDKGISSKADHDAAQHEWEAARAEYGALVEEVRLNFSLDKLKADNAVRQAEAAVNAAEQKLHIFGLDEATVATLREKKDNGDFARLPIKAPRAGTIIDQSVSEGRFVETSQSLYTIADLSNLWVWCDLYERDLAALHARLAQERTLPAIVSVAAFPDTVFPGTIDLVGSTLDEHTRTVKVRIQVSNADGKLKPGMFAHVAVAVPSGKKVTLVPREAVLSDEGKRFVFQHWRDDFWVRRDITVDDGDDQNLVVLSGLRDGVTIATGGGFMLKSDVLRNKMGAG